MKQIFDRHTYDQALAMANATNPVAITYTLARLVDQAAPHFPGDSEYVQQVAHLKTLLDEADDRFQVTRSDEFRDVFTRVFDWTWRPECRWHIGSDPAIALAVQVIANILAYEATQYGIVDSGLYHTVSNQAEIFAYGQELRVTAQPVGMTTLSLGLESGKVKGLDNEWVCSQLLVEFFSDRFVGGARVIRAETCDVVVGMVDEPLDFVREVVENRAQVQFPVVFSEVDYE